MLRDKLKVRFQLAVAAILLTSSAAFAQPQQQPQPPVLGPAQLDQLVGRVALYPDPLLAQVMPASTFWNDIPAAAGWANQHSFLTGDALARAMQEDNLPWDPSVLALLPFPTVLNMMASDPGWTQSLGNAVLAQNNDVMDAVQRMRAQAANYGYLRSGPQSRVVNAPGDIEIQPVDPAYVVVPAYNPLIVFAPPRPGFFVGGAIGFGGPRIFIGGAFLPFGWGGARLGWREHAIFIDNHAWARNYVNRGTYVHSYARPYARPAAPRVEHHEVRREERKEERRDR
jgi:Protein of unknown function (DUF3300)